MQTTKRLRWLWTTVKHTAMTPRGSLAYSRPAAAQVDWQQLALPPRLRPAERRAPTQSNHHGSLKEDAVGKFLSVENLEPVRATVTKSQGVLILNNHKGASLNSMP